MPEMFATGFSMNVGSISDDAARETQNFLARMAADYRVFMLGGVVTSGADNKGRNECVVYSPAGEEIARYCKLHPFALGGEAEHYAAGALVQPFRLNEFTIAPFICYDLRFPEIFRTAVQRGANLFTVIASWPEARADHWMSLLKARAIENQAYVVGVNRCGADPQLSYKGQSVIFDPHGRAVIEAGSEECSISADLDLPALIDYRQKLPFLRDIHKNYLDVPEPRVK
ncbi:MAG: nitrilase-related carbon-nitrogen hydrolase [Pyrinomonadaceae bacterium]